MVDHGKTPATDSLARFHERLGGHLDPEVPGRVVRYGDLEGEYRAIRRGSALVDRSWRDRLELVGADRQRFVNGLVTCDVKTLEVCRAAYGFFPSGKGKILSDVLVMALPERLWLELPAGSGSAMAEHLGKYIIADRVEVRPLEEVVPLALVGPRAEAALSDFTALPGGEDELVDGNIAEVDLPILRRRLAGQPAFTLWPPAEAAATVAAALLASDGVEPAGDEALETARVVAGIPAFGRDFGFDAFPQESGLEAEAVSYTKGCYLGQEVIARIHYRGQANRAARRLLFEGTAAPVPGSRLLLEEDEVGTVGSAALPPGAAQAVGIAVLHRRGNDPGTRLRVDGGGTVEVANLILTK